VTRTKPPGQGRARRPREATGATRDAILASARTEFARAGYAGATMRSIAARAEVDPALVIHYFGSKDALFGESLAIPDALPARMLTVLDGPPDGVAHRFVATYLEMWESPEVAPVLLGAVRSTVSNPVAADVVRRMLENEIFAQAAPHWDAERLNLVGAQVFGIAFARYVLRTEPLASLPRERVVELVAPLLQSLLTS
jgi:AcrR family transcriptional regulator